MKRYAILFDGLLVCDRSGRPVRFATRREAEARIAELHIGMFATVTEIGERVFGGLGRRLAASKNSRN